MRKVYEKYRGFNIFVEQDDLGGDGPRDWDNLGTMVCFHNRYTLGDTGGNPKWRERRRSLKMHTYEFPQFETPDDFIEYVQEDNEVAISLPLILAEHGNMWMSTRRNSYPFNCPWDSGQVGWIYVTTERLIKEYSLKGIVDLTSAEGRAVCADALENAERCLRGEVETYSQFISGEVYGYMVEDAAGECLDSCWGYYGDPGVSGLLEAAHGAVDWHITKAYKRRAEQVKAWIRNRVPHIYRTPMNLAVSL